MLELYDYYRSSASFRVRIALNIKNLDYNKIPIHLLNNGGEQLQASYQAINPQGLVPALKTDEGNIITQSLAIIEYLDELYPTPSLLPKDPYQKALIRSFCLTIAAEIHPLNNLRVLNFLTQDLGLTEDDKLKWYRHWIAMGLTALEKKLVATQSAGDFCFGSHLTMADVFLVPQLLNAKRFNCDLTPYPTLTRIDSNCLNISAFIDALPQEA